MADKGKDDDRFFAGKLTLIFLLLALFNVSRHVLWRDEIRWWQVAIFSPTFADMYRNMRFEGTPVLWYGIIWLLTKFFSSMFAMQVTHVLIASAVVFVFGWKAPFGRFIKTVFAFGYFPFFEYATISRSYGLMLLLFLIGVSIASLPRPRPMMLALVLVLLTQVSIWGAGFAALLIICTVIRWWREPEFRIAPWLVATLLVFFACLLCYFEALPGPGKICIATWDPKTPVSERVFRSLATIWNGFVPLPILQRWYWNSNILDNYPAIAAALSCVLLIFAVLMVRRCTPAMLLLLLGIGAQVAFTYFKFVGYTRHNGQLFITLIGAWWLAECWPGMKASGRLSRFLHQRRSAIIGTLLSIHMISGIGATLADWVLPFSAGKATAEYIRKSFPPTIPIMAIDDFCTSPISMYLGRDFYFPQMRRVAHFYSQNDADRFGVTYIELFEQARTLHNQSGQDVLLIFSGNGFDTSDFSMEIPATASNAQSSVHVRLIARLDDSTIGSEVYNLYQISISD